MPRKADPERDAYIAQEYAKGRAIRKIAAELGISHSTAIEARKRHERDNPAPPRAPSVQEATRSMPNPHHSATQPRQAISSVLKRAYSLEKRQIIHNDRLYARNTLEARKKETNMTTMSVKAHEEIEPTKAVVGTYFAERVNFRKLADRWEDETGMLSNTEEASRHPAYREIIEMGQPAIQMILDRMREQGGHWFIALQEITGENPVERADWGYVRKMEEAWLRWGTEHGYA